MPCVACLLCLHPELLLLKQRASRSPYGGTCVIGVAKRRPAQVRAAGMAPALCPRVSDTSLRCRPCRRLSCKSGDSAACLTRVPWLCGLVFPLGGPQQGRGREIPVRFGTLQPAAQGAQGTPPVVPKATTSSQPHRLEMGMQRGDTSCSPASGDALSGLAASKTRVPFPAACSQESTHAPHVCALPLHWAPLSPRAQGWGREAPAAALSPWPEPLG